MYPQSKRTVHSRATRKMDQTTAPLTLALAPLPVILAATPSLRHARTRRIRCTPAKVRASCPPRKKPVHLLKCVWSPLLDRRARLRTVFARTMVYTAGLHSLTLASSRRTVSTSVKRVVSQPSSRIVELVPVPQMLSKQPLFSGRPPRTFVSIFAPA